MKLRPRIWIEDLGIKCDTLRNLVPFVQIKNREKQRWGSGTFLKFGGCERSTTPWVFFMFFKLYEWYKIVQSITNPAGIYLLKVNNGSTRTRCEICSKLTIKIPEWRHASFFFIVNFEHISHLVLVFLLLTLNM